MFGRGGCEKKMCSGNDAVRKCVPGGVPVRSACVRRGLAVRKACVRGTVL